MQRYRSQTVTPMREIVAAEVRAQMARRRITQQMLADELGREQTWVSRRVSGKVAFTVDDLAVISALFRVPIALLLGDEEPPERPESQVLDRRGLRRRSSTCTTEPILLAVAA